MADAQQLTPFGKQCLDALQSLGKTLGQMTLYKIGHPAVAATIQLALDHLLAALTQEPEIAFSIDGDKVIGNGRIIGPVSALPNSIPALFVPMCWIKLHYNHSTTVENHSRPATQPSPGTH